MRTLTVARGAGDGCVRTRQRIPGGCVLRDRETGGLEGDGSVAGLAAVLIGRAAELAAMSVLVASGAGGVLNPIDGSVWVRNVAFHA